MSSYPTSNDSLSNPVDGNPLSDPDHAALHTSENSAIIAIETTVGNTGSFNFVSSSATVSGDLSGAILDPTVAKINTSPLGTTTGASVGEGLIWNGSAWAKGVIGSGGPPSGAAGGSLAGSYPNPTIANSGVTANSYLSANITVGADGRITAASNGTGGSVASGAYNAIFNPYSYSATGGSNDTTAVQNCINAAVAASVAANVYLPSIFNVSGVSVTNAVAPITISGPGGLKFTADVSASSAILNIVNSPYTSVRGIILDENGQNQTNANICGVAYDNASSNVSVFDCLFKNAIGFVFFKGGGVPGVFTTDVSFCRNTVECYTAGVYQDMVVMTMANRGHCDSNTVVGMSATFSAINVYESNQVTCANNTVTLVSPSGTNAVFGISVQSSQGCPVTGNTVWGNGTGAAGFYAYAAFTEGDNGTARAQVDALFTGNHAYQTAGTNGVPFYLSNASVTSINGGTYLGFAADVFLAYTDAIGAVQVSNVDVPGLTAGAFFYNGGGGTVSPGPSFFGNSGTQYAGSFNGNESRNVVATSTSAFTLTDPGLANIDDITLSANCTITGWANPQAGDAKDIIIRQKSSGGTYNYTVSWTGSTFKCPGGTKPTMSTGASAYDEYVVTYDGTNFNLIAIGQAFA